MIQILEGHYDSEIGAAVLFSTDTETAFGPLFDDQQEAESFLIWWGGTFPGQPVETVTTATLVERLKKYRREVETLLSVQV